MTGIERLRTLAGARDEWILGGTLADIADQIERERDAEVADSPYDAILPKDRDAIAWVRDHGGIDYVRAEWRSRVPRDRYEMRRQRLLGHIAECETALGRRREIISKLGHRVSDLTRENAELRKRAMPEGCEWPLYESGEPVRIGDKIEDIEVRSIVFNENGILLSDCTSVPGWGTWRSYKERVKRPAVPAADGKPLEVGQTVWDVESGEELKVEKLCDVGLVQLLTRDGVSRYVYPDQLTHTKPEIDTWQRIEEDAGCTATKYNERRGTIFTTKQQVARDLVRRCKALAEKENRNE